MKRALIAFCLLIAGYSFADDTTTNDWELDQQGRAQEYAEQFCNINGLPKTYSNVTIEPSGCIVIIWTGYEIYDSYHLGNVANAMISTPYAEIEPGNGGLNYLKITLCPEGSFLEQEWSKTISPAAKTYRKYAHYYKKLSVEDYNHWARISYSPVLNLPPHPFLDTSQTDR